MGSGATAQIPIARTTAYLTISMSPLAKPHLSVLPENARRILSVGSPLTRTVAFFRFSAPVMVPVTVRIFGLDARGSEWLARSLTHLPKRLFAATPRVKDAFDRLFSVYDGVGRKSPSRRVRMRAAALDLLIAIIDAARRPPAKAPDRIGEIARRIREKPNAEYPVADLAKEADLSLSAFANAFKRAMGLPLHAYVLNCRINRAKRLLLTTKRTVTSIGQELHFYSTQHFALTFKRIVGKYPKDFRLSAQADQKSANA